LVTLGYFLDSKDLRFTLMHSG